MAYIGVIEVVKAYAQPVQQLRKFLQVPCMEPGVRILGGVGQCICKVLLQITLFLDPVCLLKLIFRERDGNIVFSDKPFYC